MNICLTFYIFSLLYPLSLINLLNFNLVNSIRVSGYNKLNYNKLNQHKSDQIITNRDFPSCKNCKYYQPKYYDNDFTSSLNHCFKFGTKDIITDEIRYSYADTARNDEKKCGLEGKYFEKENNLTLKIIKHKIISSTPYIILISLFVLSAIANVYTSIHK